MFKFKTNIQFTKLGVALTLAGIAFLGNQFASAEPNFKRPKIHKTKSIYDRCDILSHNGNHTLVPKNGLIIIPDQYKDRVTTKPKGKFLNWANFYKKNYQWLHKEEISMDIARGKKQLTDQKIESLQALSMIVVAVHKDNPISRLKPQPLPEE